MTLRWLAIMLLAAGAARAADRDFERVVKKIEARYGRASTHVPLMGLANFFVKVARPSGTSSFHIEVFERVDGLGGDRDDFMEGLDRGRLHRMVRVESHEGEATYILADDAGKTTRLVIASFGRDSVVVLQVRVNAAALRRTVEHPQGMAKAYLGRQDAH